ncbi:amino acid ABC transporter substrate-binding protein [Meridianimarinicoccus roseus]|uniref:Amino acid ABC transporter substrate-binding protein n=2 Tax=Meridianimarinicoccus roseus TaxID=2072018 RepID=A0A2V2LMI9_9RHOB|nr:amino acid ABC transporter substrate-binding protein [Meridianimarinicoccus roseus]
MPAWADHAARVRGGAAGALAAFALGLMTAPGGAQTSDLVSTSALRVCADPANDPMSSEDGSGYENELAELIAGKLDLPVEYTWFPMATGFVRQTLMAKRCDVIMAYAQGHELVLNTNHYLTSVYALIVPADGPLADVETLSDPRLNPLRIGVIAGSPPATHMARNGLIGKAKGYNLFVDRRHESPAPNMLADLEAGEIDAAILWGPLGGPLVKRDHPNLKVIPLVKETLPPKLHYRITMGVRQGEKVWQRQLNSLIRRNQDEINALLHDAGVPLVTDLGDAVMDLSQ